MHGPDEPQDTSDPVDPRRVAADDELVQRIADGQPPPTGSRAGDTLAHWKATVEQGLPPRYSDPATTFLPHPLYDSPVHNPIKWWPIGDTAPVDVPPREDDWCEDRSPSELTDADEVD